MKTYSISDNKTYRTHKEICEQIGVKPAPMKCWYKIDNQSYIWAPKIVSESSNWNLIKAVKQDGVEVKWVNFLSLDGEKLYSGELNNNAVPKNTLQPYSNYQQVVFGKYPGHGCYYEFLGVFKYNGEHIIKKGVNFSVFNRKAKEF
jgi:hypothetical protein